MVCFEPRGREISVTICGSYIFGFEMQAVPESPKRQLI